MMTEIDEELDLEEQSTTEAEKAKLIAEHAVAHVKGQALTSLPQDLYIPPDALEVILEAFEGPLDLLLYLIRKHDLDILDIPIAEITKQYIEYIEVMKSLRLELAADYLVMAAVLAEIKSRMLLPRPKTEEEEEDPRAQLMRRLQEYERFKQAAQDLDELPRKDRDFFTSTIPVEVVKKAPELKIDIKQLVNAFVDVLKRSELLSTHTIQREPLSVRERMSRVLELINSNDFISFESCFDLEEGKMGVIVSFLAILELLKLGAIDVIQTENFGPIHLKALAGEDDE